MGMPLSLLGEREIRIMFKSFIMEFIKNRSVQKGTILCLLLEMIKSGSIIHSFFLISLVLLSFFALCYLILFGRLQKPQKKKRRISEQYRHVN